MNAMWEYRNTIDNFFDSKRYREALSFTIEKMERKINEGKLDEIEKVIREKKWFLNTTGDANRTSLFCEKLMDYCLSTDLDLKDYVRQCQLLNKELDHYGERFNVMIRELYLLHPTNALHVILNVFENINHYILNEKPNELERIYYGPFVYNMESVFESSTTALNRMLGLWLSGCHKGAFRGKYNQELSLKEAGAELQKQLVPIVRAVNHLEWLCEQISIQQVTLEENMSQVIFTIQDNKDYYRYKLPTIRETVRMHSFFFREEKPSQSSKQIDYNRIVKVKESGDDFKLVFGIDILLNQLKESIEIANKNTLLMLQDMYITNMMDMKVSSKEIKVFEAFMFYHCLRTFAVIYYEATKHFMKTYQKEPKAPFLCFRNNEIIKYLQPLLKALFKRDVSTEEINNFIGLFTFGNDGINDLYYKPIIVCQDSVVLNPSIYIMNNFAKTFLNHLSTLGVNLSERGDTFEVAVQSLFEIHEFKVYKEKYPFNFIYENKTVEGDIDLIARKGSYLYVGQLKNRLEPLESQDYRGADKKIKIGVKQSKKTLLYIQQNPEEFCGKIGIKLDELKGMEIKPFVLVSCFYGSGQIIDDIPVTDMSALTRFLSEGQIRVFPGDGEPFVQDLRTQGEVIPEEFNDFLMNPYFLNSDVYGLQLAIQHTFPIRERDFILRSKEDPQEQLKNSFITAGAKHFIENNLL